MTDDDGRPDDGRPDDGRPDDDAPTEPPSGESSPGGVDVDSPDDPEGPFVFEADADVTDGHGTEGRRRPPLSGLADRVADRRAQTAARDDVEALFEQVDTGDVDGENLWTSLVDDDPATAEGGVGVGAEATPVSDSEAPADHVVPKSTFCQRCSYFAAPPELACTHDGTAIVEVTDSEHFRVHNCPMVDDADD